MFSKLDLLSRPYLTLKSLILLLVGLLSVAYADKLDEAKKIYESGKVIFLDAGNEVWVISQSI